MDMIEKMAEAHRNNDLAVEAGLEARWDRIPEGVRVRSRNTMRAALAVLPENIRKEIIDGHD